MAETPDGSDGRLMVWRFIKGTVGLSLIGALSACQAGDGAYPSLHAVPDQPRPSLTVEERRQIVRGLIDQRDQNREETAIVRERSGLQTRAEADQAVGDTEAEDVVPAPPEGEDEAFKLKATSKVPADSVYRSDAQFDDGSLDDFIRRLKRDTRPAAPETVDEPPTEAAETDEISSILEPAADQALAFVAGEPLYWLPAFAPALHHDVLGDDDLTILLAAAEEPGVMCRYFGWAVAWSTMCLDAGEAVPSDDGDEPVGADLEQELSESSEEEAIGRTTETPSSDNSEPGREGVGRRLSEEDAAEAIEDAGRSVLAPVTSSLDRLRDYLDERRSRETAPPAAPSEPAPTARPATPSARAAAPDRPPIPEGRPERREDITVVDKGERFDFVRTPRPAFKPSPDLPVILPPEPERPVVSSVEKRADPPPAPVARPGDLVSDRDDERPVASTSDTPDEPDSGLRDDAVALALATDGGIDAAASPKPPEPAEREADRNEPTIIHFEPEQQGTPDEVNAELMALLVDAKARRQKIHIIGEASSNHVARRRATDVGAVLVQLGATVEILEYDHEAIAGVDRVRLVLVPDASLSQALTANPTLVDK
ncbi:MAG: hypothetical protein AAF543_02295 [Pseudomonadota bacterium]